MSVETSNSCGEEVLQGTAEIAQPATVYLFTGQNLQESCMGMLLHAQLGKVQIPIYMQFDF